MEYIPWIISGVSMLVAIMSFARTVRKDNTEELGGIKESLLKANIKLDQVCATTNETRTDIKAINAKISDMDKELEVVKRDLATAFMRIDELRGNQNELLLRHPQG